MRNVTIGEEVGRIYVGQRNTNETLGGTIVYLQKLYARVTI
jgi:hypothetical protein